MALTINDIQDKQFHVKFRGFDIEEVDEFLELVAENFAVLVNDNEVLTCKIKSVSEDLDSVKSQESSFRNAILSAQKIADEMIKKGREEADNMIAKAQEDIKILKDDAHKEVGELEARVDKLSVMQRTLQKELSDVLALYQQKFDEVPESSIPDEIAENSEEYLNEEIQQKSDGEPDLTDLYEKIDLDDDLTVVSSLQEENSLESGEQDEEFDNPSGDDDPVATTGIPDLDSEIMFKLHDPLDEDESDVDVAIDGEKNNN